MGRGAGRRVSEIRARGTKPGTGRTILNLAVGACVSPTDSIITTCASGAIVACVSAGDSNDFFPSDCAAWWFVLSRGWKQRLCAEPLVSLIPVNPVK